MFMFFLNAVPFLVSLQFYIVGFLILYGLVGVICLDDKAYRIISAIGVILGFLTVILAAFLASKPVVIAIIIGVLVIVEGVLFIVIGRSKSLIEKYG